MSKRVVSCETVIDYRRALQCVIMETRYINDRLVMFSLVMSIPHP